MTTNTARHASAAQPPSSRTDLWKKVVIGASIFVVLGVAWRTVYVSNQNELKLRRALRKSQSIHAALSDVPARRFSTIDVRPSAAQKNDLIARYG
ncbi:hypothetical protein JKF63_02490 [Porcisia hertigi]|uniref:Uncharacterized protein n=1 Tax=Porcisia hertigi TaxID=2761500 RepID=A0A836L2U3_9TRYP|nr:hypothetical protein JKF63_02490 [Porcisia hertigi]